MNLTHQQLVESLRAVKRARMIEVCLGSPFLRQTISDPPIRRADLVLIRPSYADFQIDIYEVKASRADYLQDKKFVDYLPYCNRFFFAAVEGVIRKEDVPSMAGLWLFGGNGWYCAKSAKRRSLEIEKDVKKYTEFLKAMLFWEQKNPWTPRRPYCQVDTSGKSEKEVKRIANALRSLGVNVTHRSDGFSDGSGVYLETHTPTGNKLYRITLEEVEREVEEKFDIQRNLFHKAVKRLWKVEAENA